MASPIAAALPAVHVRRLTETLVPAASPAVRGHNDIFAVVQAAECVGATEVSWHGPQVPDRKKRKACAGQAGRQAGAQHDTQPAEMSEH